MLTLKPLQTSTYKPSCHCALGCWSEHHNGDRDGGLAMQLFEVTRTDLPVYVEVLTNTTEGLPPLDVNFQVQQIGEAAQDFRVAQLDIDFEGDGTIDYTDTGIVIDPNNGTITVFPIDVSEPVLHTYTIPGLFLADVTVTTYVDAVEVIQKFAIPINVMSLSLIDQIVNGIWDDMHAALLAGDVSGALNYLQEGARDKYGPVFEVLLPHIADMMQTYTPLERTFVGPGLGEYAIAHELSGQRQVFLMYFTVGGDGVWRASEM